MQYDSTLDTTGRTLIGPNLGTPGKFTPTGGIQSNGALAVSVQSATALTVARVGTTDPALTVNTNTASSVTGVAITGAAAGGAAALAATSSAANEALNINAKGTGVVQIANVSTGAVNLGSGVSIPQAGPAAVAVNTATDSVLGFFAGTTTVGQKLIGAAMGTSATGITVTAGADSLHRWNWTRTGNIVEFKHWFRATPAATTTPVIVAYDLSTMASPPLPNGGTFEATTAADGGIMMSGITVATQLQSVSTVAAGAGSDVITATLTTAAAAVASAATEFFVHFWYDVSQ